MKLLLPEGVCLLLRFSSRNFVVERSRVTCLLLNCGFRNFDFGVMYFLSGGFQEF